MTGLHRTELSTPLKAQLAASAFALQGHHGAVSALAADFDVSRPTVYAASCVGETVLVDHFAREEAGADGVWIFVDRAQLERSIVGLRSVAPVSLRDIEELIPIIYPKVTRSFGWIQSVCAEAERRAHRHNQSVDLSPIDAAALDELFSQRQPVLAGVDLDTGYCFGVSLEDHRGGDQWAEVLRRAQSQGLDLGVVVKDAALGIARGVRDVFPEAEQRDDCFHALYEMGKVARALEQTAYRRIAEEENVAQDLERLWRTGKGPASRRSLAQRLTHARKRADRAIERFDSFVLAQCEVEEALHAVDLETGHLRTPRQIEKALRSAGAKMLAIDHYKAKKVGRYIINRAPGLALHMKALRKALARIARKHKALTVRLAVTIHRLHEELSKARYQHQRREHQQMLAAVWLMLRREAGDQAGEVLAVVSEVMSKRHRASSAIEGFNAGLRPYLYVHRGVSQGFLELFQAYQNLRTRRWGRLKGSSAHEALTGHAVEDWLTELGYPGSARTLH